MTLGRAPIGDDDAERRPSRTPGQQWRPSPRQGVPTAAQLMNRRPPVADQDTSLWGGWELLCGPGNRYLVVVDRHVRPVGVLEARDLALRWPPGPFDAHRVPLHQVLGGGPVPHVRGADRMATVARTMLTTGTDAVPVVDDDGRLVGLVTARTCVEVIAGPTTT
jgi:CBS domain-containing protein